MEVGGAGMDFGGWEMSRGKGRSSEVAEKGGGGSAFVTAAASVCGTSLDPEAGEEMLNALNSGMGSEGASLKVVAALTGGGGGA